METDKRGNKIPEWLIIATSLFRFYYYVIRRSNKKYDIAANPKESTMAMFFPVIFILAYPLTFGIFMSELLVTSTTVLLIPLFILNIIYLNHISNEGYRLRRAKLDKEHEKVMEELDRARDKRKRKEDERMRRESKEWDDQIDRLVREYIRQQREDNRRKEEVRQKASVDQNKLNAIKLMGLSDNPTTEEAKKAYRKLSKTHHPDTGGTHENFIRLTKAYEYLVKVL